MDGYFPDIPRILNLITKGSRVVTFGLYSFYSPGESPHLFVAVVPECVSEQEWKLSRGDYPPTLLGIDPRSFACLIVNQFI